MISQLQKYMTSNDRMIADGEVETMGDKRLVEHSVKVGYIARKSV
jgi:hypothetical protein